jgi:hypothetical protein
MTGGFCFLPSNQAGGHLALTFFFFLFFPSLRARTSFPDFTTRYTIIIFYHIKIHELPCAALSLDSVVEASAAAAAASSSATTFNMASAS